jgi:DNA-binding NarL/FixJ family response regulator
MTAAVAFVGKPSESIGTRVPAADALFAASGPATPSMAPRVLATTGAERLPSVDAPTLKEQGGPRRVREHRPQLVLLDIHLPDINGLQLLPALRREHEDLDVIVISAAREAESVRRALRGGIVHYLLKPFSADDLRATLQHYRETYAGCRPSARRASRTSTGSSRTPGRPAARRPPGCRRSSASRPPTWWSRP